MDYIHITFDHKNEEAPEETVKRLPNCPVCGAKAFLHGDAPDGFWMGWSIGCPRYCLNDGIHGHNFNTPHKEHLTRCGFTTKKSAIAWWKKRVKMENERTVATNEQSN